MLNWKVKVFDSVRIYLPCPTKNQIWFLHLLQFGIANVACQKEFQVRLEFKKKLNF